MSAPPSLDTLDVLTKADGKAYFDALKRWSETSEKEAQYVVLPRTSKEVAQAILFAREKNLDLAIKGGGHSTSGSCASEGVVVDLSVHLKTVVVSEDKKYAVVGGGALWKDVNDELEKHNVATVGGTVQSTGVGGLTVGGGYGFLSGQYGLVIDNLVEAEVVLANGEVVVASDSGEHKDLFWAIRGAGSNFGPVTSFKFKVYPQENQVWTGLMFFPPPKLEAFFKAAEAWFSKAEANEAINIFIGCAPPTDSQGPQPLLVLLPFYNGQDEEEAKRRFKPFIDVEPVPGPPGTAPCMRPYKESNTLQDAMTTPGDRKAFKATKFAHWDIPRFQKLFDDFSAFITTYPNTWKSSIVMEFYPHEQIGNAGLDDAAFPNRVAGFGLLFVPRWEDPSLDKTMLQWARDEVKYADDVETKLNEKLGGSVRDKGPFHGSPGYPNYGLGDERSSNMFGSNYPRLQRVKAKYDPEKVFNKWYVVEPKA